MRYWFIFFPCWLMAQKYFTQPGQWRSYLNHYNILDIIAAPPYVFAISDVGVIRYHTKEQALYFYTTVEGLHSLYPSAIAYDSIHQIIAIGYKDGTIDFLFMENLDSIIPSFDIYLNKNLTFKEIYAMVPYKGEWFIATGFGIVIFNQNRMETIANYFQIGNNPIYTEVRDIAIWNDTLWVAMNNGLWYLPLQNRNFNPIWYKDPFFGDKRIFFVENTISTLIVATKDSLMYRTKESQWQLLYQDSVFNTPFIHLRAHQDYIAWVKPPLFEGYGFDARQWENFYRGWNWDCRAFVTYDSLMLFSGTKNQGLFLVMPQYGAEVPLEETIFSENLFGAIEWANGNLYLVERGRQGITPTYTSKGVFIYHLREGTKEIVKDTSQVYIGLHNISYDPISQNLYFSSWYQGVLVMQGNQAVASYTEPDLIGLAPGMVQIADVKRDSKGNLWFLSRGASTPLQVLTPDGQWYYFALPEKDFMGMTIDENDYKWLITRSKGIWVFDENNTLNDYSDDKLRYLSTEIGQGNLRHLKVNCIVTDKDGYLWVGTDDGVSVFYLPSIIFQNSPEADAACPLVEGFCLLRERVVTTIAVDGANRKWIGTNQGLFLISPDGTQQIYHFNTRNSPLFSDYIIDLALDPETGEVFILTDRGLISYTAEATEPAKEQMDALFVFPNPVPPSYNGPITIRGTVQDADIRICTIDGTVIKRLQSIGGQAIWDGTDGSGSPVVNGIYLIIVTDKEGKIKGSAKIAYLAQP